MFRQGHPRRASLEKIRHFDHIYWRSPSTTYNGKVGRFLWQIRVTERLILVRTDIGRQAEGIVAAGGLLPDEMMLDLITTRLDTLKENASIF